MTLRFHRLTLQMTCQTCLCPVGARYVAMPRWRCPFASASGTWNGASHYEMAGPIPVYTWIVPEE